MSEKTKGEQLKEKLFFEFENAYNKVDDKEAKAAFDYSENYMEFLDNSRTERECVSYSVKLLENAGFTPFSYGNKYKAGDKIYYNNRNKSIIAAVIGKNSLNDGVNIAAAHIDSPRLDLKPMPIYEDNELCLFKTHYYGGIKKYQWTAIPLALCGVIIKKDGNEINVNIGMDINDPIFCITDLLPHLARTQMSKTMSEGIEGENLNVLIGSRPYADDKVSEKVKLNILSVLFDKYGITEADFNTAELCIVPAFKARDLGMDRSMIGAYGHDDKVCAYPCISSVIDLKDIPAKTAICCLTDREEIGSTGNTGLESNYLKNFIEELCVGEGANIRQCLHNSNCLSADVNAAFDPTYPSVYEKNNCAKINKGTVISKYTGSGGKVNTNDASAEFMNKIINIMNNNNVIWQTGELGKVDAGGGGTVAKYVSHYDINVVDLGVAVLSMHAPLEVISKMDLYMTYRAVLSFLKDA